MRVEKLKDARERKETRKVTAISLLGVTKGVNTPPSVILHKTAIKYLNCISSPLTGED